MEQASHRCCNAATVDVATANETCKFLPVGWKQKEKEKNEKKKKEKKKKKKKNEESNQVDIEFRE